MIRRVLIFSYGVLVYAFFFAVFCYMFGFGHNLWVPKSIDAPAADGNFPVWLAPALLLLFGVQHAVMARPRFKQWLTQYLPPSAERSTFVLVSALLLAGAMFTWQPIAGTLWSVENEVLKYALLGLAAAGYGLVLIASFLIDHFDLFGLRQVSLQLMGKPYTQRAFVERWLYRRVRHPLMLGFLIWLWSTPQMSLGHLLFSSILTCYIAIGVRLEERDLIAMHGPAYRSYQQRVPMVLPRLRSAAHAAHGSGS